MDTLCIRWDNRILKSQESFNNFSSGINFANWEHSSHLTAFCLTTCRNIFYSHGLCCSRKYRYPPHGNVFVWISPLTHLTLALYLPLKIADCFWASHPLRIFKSRNDFPWGEYIAYFLELQGDRFLEVADPVACKGVGLKVGQEPIGSFCTSKNGFSAHWIQSDCRLKFCSPLSPKCASVSLNITRQCCALEATRCHRWLTFVFGWLELHLFPCKGLAPRISWLGAFGLLEFFCRPQPCSGT